MKQIAKILAAFAALFLLLYAVSGYLIWKNQRGYLYYPTRGRLAEVPVLTLERGGVKVLVSTRELAGPKAVLYLGGNAEDVSASLPELGVDFPDAAIYALHYRGYGGSGGSPSEAALVGDALALFDRIQREHPQVRVIGRSLGSGIAVQIASQRKVQALVLVTPYDSIASIAARQFPYYPIDAMLQDRYDSWKYAARVKVPTLLILAEQDRLIPRDSSLKLLASFAPGVAQAVTIPGVGHNSISQSTEYDAALMR